MMVTNPASGLVGPELMVMERQFGCNFTHAQSIAGLASSLKLGPVAGPGEAFAPPATAPHWTFAENPGEDAPRAFAEANTPRVRMRHGREASRDTTSMLLEKFVFRMKQERDGTERC